MAAKAYKRGQDGEVAARQADDRREADEFARHFSNRFMKIRLELAKIRGVDCASEGASRARSHAEDRVRQRQKTRHRLQRFGK